MATNFSDNSNNQKWIFTKAQLRERRQKDLQIFSEEEYVKLGIFFPNFFQDIAAEWEKALDLDGFGEIRPTVVATAVVYLKRFYLVRSFQDVCPITITLLALKAASQTEKAGQLSVLRLKETAVFVLKENYNFNWYIDTDAPFSKDLEYTLLETLDYTLTVFHPNSHLETLLDELKDYVTNEELELKSECWLALNHCLRGDFCLLYAPDVIALAALMIAANWLGWHREKLSNWPCMKDEDVDREKLEELLKDFDEISVVLDDNWEGERLTPLLKKLPKSNSTWMAWNSAGALLPLPHRTTINHRRFHPAGF